VKVKEKKQRAEVPFDPVLFAATVPSCKPTAKDIADIKAHKSTQIRFDRAEGLRIYGGHGQGFVIFRRTVRFKKECALLHS
jgi:hypothetical protein